MQILKTPDQEFTVSGNVSSTQVKSGRIMLTSQSKASVCYNLNWSNHSNPLGLVKGNKLTKGHAASVPECINDAHCALSGFA